MISDQPDEGADDLNDDTLLTTYLDGGSAKPASEATSGASDWPTLPTQDLSLSVDAVTLRWFETNYGDWRQGMCSVLRAWVDMRSRGVIDVTTPPEPPLP